MEKQPSPQAKPSSKTIPAALITGGGRGVGRTITLRLAKRQPVVVLGRNTDDAQSVCKEVSDSGGHAIAWVGDIADPVSARQAVAAAAEQNWWIAHLVCNAGIGKTGPTESFPFDRWQEIFAVNVHGCLHSVQACLPGMLERNSGTISIMSSLAGVQGVAFDAAYTASKHALVGLARALIREYQKRGIVVAALCPSFIESEMTQRTLRGMMNRQGLSTLEAEKRLASKCPGGRVLPAEEIAEAIALIGGGQLEQALELAAAGSYPLIYQS